MDQSTKEVALFKVKKKKDNNITASDTGACLAGLRWDWSGYHNKPIIKSCYMLLNTLEMENSTNNVAKLTIKVIFS